MTELSLASKKAPFTRRVCRLFLQALSEKLGVPDPATHSALLRARLREPALHAEGVAAYWGRRYVKLATLELARRRKSMSVLCARPGNRAGNVLLVKGAFTRGEREEVRSTECVCVWGGSKACLLGGGVLLS